MSGISTNAIGLVVDTSSPLSTTLGGTGNTSGSTPPSGSAGGDLSGTYPNPNVTKINTVPVTSSSVSDGQFLIGSTSGNNYTAASITGTTNQVNVSNGSHSITLGLPQSIGSSSSPQFTGLNLSSLNASQAVVTDGSKNLISLVYTNSNTPSTLVERDSSGNFSAGIITASLNGNATSSTTTTTATNANNIATTQVSTNSTYYPILVSSSTNSNQAPDLSTGLTYNPSTNILSTTRINLSGLTPSELVGTDASNNLISYTLSSSNTPSSVVQRDASGNFSANTITASLNGNATTSTTATTATNATNVATTQVSTNANYFPLMVSSSTNSNQSVDLGTGLTFNPNTNTLTATTFVGSLTGTASSATNATNVGTTQVTTNASYFPLMVSSSTNSNQSSDLSVGLTYNPSTNILSTTGLNLSGLTASQAVVTDSSKNLVSLGYTNLNTANTLVERDTSGNFSAGTITATLSGNASTSTTSTNATNISTTLTSTNSTFYPIFVSSNTTTNQGVDVGSGITFNPSTNVLTTTTFSGALLGNASTATTATNATNIGTTQVTNNASYFPLMAASSTNSNQAPDLSTGLTFNPSTNTLTTTTFVGALTGTATNATTATNANNVSTTQVTSNASYFPLLVASSTNSNQPADLGIGLTFNPSTNTLATTTFSGALSGNATTSTTSTNANNVATTQVTTNATYYPLLAASSTNSNQPVDLGTGLTFNPSTNTLTTTLFSGSLSGNATSATTATTATNANNVATTQVSTNSSFFPLMVASSTNGNQSADLGTGLTFNPSTNTLTTTIFSGSLSGNATSATTATTATTATNANNVATNQVSTNASFFPLFVSSSTNSNQSVDLGTGLTFNPSTNTLTTTTFTGSLSGNATTATTATNANNVATNQVSTNASYFPLMSASSTNSNQAVDLGTGLTFNPSTNTLTTTTFSGALSGNATSATTATNSNNVATTQVTTNASYFPLMVSSSTNSNQAADLSTGWTFNPNTNTLTTSIINATGSALIGSAPLTSTAKALTFSSNLQLGNYINMGGSGKNIGVTFGGHPFISCGLDYNATTDAYIYNNSGTGPGCSIELTPAGTILLTTAPSGTNNNTATTTTQVSISNTGVVNLSNLTASSLVVTDGSQNLTSTNTLSSTVLGNVTKVTKTILTTGSGTYTTPANATHLRIMVWGSGGGGGGAATAAASSAVGGGGGGGGYSELLITSPAASYSYAIGTAGTGGAAGNNNGGSAGTTTFGPITVPGGTGGTGGAAGLGASLTQGASRSTTPTGGDVNIPGGYGQSGIALSAALVLAGAGGSAALGAPAIRASVGAGAGASGISPGAGGSGGAVASASAAVAGGNGATGEIIVEEYYVG